jgi:glucuronate isomerase
MAKFLGEDYLISNASGLALHAGIKDLPIVDAHNHADVAEIAENRHFTDIWHVEGATDHYFWEMLRKRGIAEPLITGNAPNREKWRAAASVWDDLAGNPTYEWVYLDLKRLLGIDTAISAATADAIYDAAKAVFQRDDMRPQGLLKRMNVEVMCSTDDPIDSLEHHQALADSAIPGMVRPTFRPDRAMNVFKPDWRVYMDQLQNRVNGSFSSIRDVVDALRICHDYFAANDCVASDHGLEVPYGYSVDVADADSAFRKAWAGKTLSKPEEVAYMSYVLQEVAALDSAKGWVFQLHIGAVRDVRDHLAQTIGPDTGGDISNHHIDVVAPLRDLLNRFDSRLKVVLYCLDPSHQPTMATLSRAFGRDVNLGSGWWFNDTPYGMRQQLEYVAGVDLLMNHVGMVSDSRKIASYASRHEMFRRILCDVLGNMVERGRVPISAAERLAEHVAYHNQKAIFGL